MKINVEQITSIIEKILIELNIRNYKIYKYYDEDHSYVTIDESNGDKYINVDYGEILIVDKKYLFGRFVSPDYINVKQINNENELVGKLQKIIKKRFASYIFDEEFCKIKHDVNHVSNLVIKFLNKLNINNFMLQKNEKTHRIIINNNKNQYIEINNNIVRVNGKNFFGFIKHAIIHIDNIYSEVFFEIKFEEYVKKCYHVPSTYLR
jgi:hypothetical protein